MYKNGIDYIAFQPGFEIFSKHYKNFIPDKNDKVLNIVSDFYEIDDKNLIDKSIITVPDGCTDIVFSFNNKAMKTFIFVGVKSLKKVYFGNVRYLFGVRFKPGGTYHIFRDPIKDFLYNPVYADDFLIDSRLLIEKMMYSKSFFERIELFREYLLYHILTESVQSELLDYCVKAICYSGGNLKIREISEKMGYSTQYIGRLFNNYIAISPKTLSEIIKIQAGLRSLSNRSSLTSVAFDVGFSDQSHMNRTFKKYMKYNLAAFKDAHILTQKINEIEQINFL